MNTEDELANHQTNELSLRQYEAPFGKKCN